MVKNPPANAGDIRDAGSIPAWGKSPGGRYGNPLDCSLAGASVQRFAVRQDRSDLAHTH